ncbi:response regulator transcription factor [Bradyrhizobium diazoefficiens]
MRMSIESKKRDVALVVDDSPETLRLLTDALDGAGMTVMVALDGAAAMRIVEQITPDIVLLDAVMPGIDGFETCRRLKRDAGLANVPVIFMTGLAETEHIVRGLDAGGVDYVTKPIVIEEMLARIRVHLGNARLTQSARAALDVSGRFLFAVNRQGSILWATPQAQKLLSDHHGAQADDFALPPSLLHWLEQAKGKGSSKSQGASLPDNPQLRFYYMGETAPNEFLLRLSKESGTALPPEFTKRARPHHPRRGSAGLAQQGQDQSRHRADPGIEPAHGRQASRADLCEAGRGEPDSGGRRLRRARQGGIRSRCANELGHH